MDGQRFDKLTKALAAGSSRRSLIKGLLGLGGAAAIPGALAAGSAAQSGQPQCPEGQERCKGQCVSPATFASDPRNCGSCGNTCGGRATCAGGICVPPVCQPRCEGKTCGSDGCGGSCGTCLADQVCQNDRRCCTPKCAGKCTGEGDGCGGACVNPDPCCGSSDPCCGSSDPCCGVTCSETELCVDGGCVANTTTTTSSPATTTTTTDPAPTTTTGVPTTTTPTPPTSTTSNPGCLDFEDCQPGQVCCGGTCQQCCGSDTSTCDANKCNTYTCSNGTCVYQGSVICLPPLFSDCYDGGTCNRQTGTCENRQYRGDDTPCGPIVAPGANGQVCCGGSCIDRDEDNCSGCGDSCLAGGTCTGGQCTCSADADCGTGKVCCNGTCQECCADNIAKCLPQPNRCSQTVCTDGTCDTIAVFEQQACIPPYTLFGICVDGNCCGCLIDGQCLESGDPKPGSLCEICNPVYSNTAWSTRTCTGNISTCSPDACDPADGQCRPQPAPDGTECLGVVAGQCQTGNACQGGICVPVNKPNGTACVAAESSGEVACSSGAGTCQEGQCVATAVNDGETCGLVFGSAPPCAVKVCRSGSCVTEPINEQVECATSEALCREATGVCVQGACTGQSKPDQTACGRVLPCQSDICIEGECVVGFQPDGIACGPKLTECLTQVCQDGTCQLAATPGDICGVGTTQCLKENICLESSSCSNVGNVSGSFCTDVAQSARWFCPSEQIVPAQCNGDGTCSLPVYRSGTVVCREDGDCCPGQICANRNRDGELSIWEMCWYPEDL